MRPRAVGLSGRIRNSSTTTSCPKAATLRPGNNLNSSVPRCALRSNRCAGLPKATKERRAHCARAAIPSTKSFQDWEAPMDTIRTEDIDHQRRRLLGTAAKGIVAAGAASLLPSQLAAAPDDAIRPFRVNVPEADLVDLRRRIAATRWPDRETVKDQSQGAPLAKLQEFVRYWGTDYDSRKGEAKLNALPQFVTTIDDVDIHFIHVRSRHPNAMPLIMTHGWPGSVFELLKTIGPLTDPTAHGGRAEDAFDLVMPSIPGYGFSGKPKGTGWDPDHI